MSETISKGELIKKVQVATSLSKKQATEAVNTTLNIIKSTVSAGDKVQLNEFGSFEPVYHQARKGRNPQTGEEINIAARHTPTFRPSKNFKNEVQTELDK